MPSAVFLFVYGHAGPLSGGGSYEAAPQISIVTHSKRDISVQLKHDIGLMGTEVENEHLAERVGVWRRRRRLDGALNRVPKEFFSQVWYILEKVGWCRTPCRHIVSTHTCAHACTNMRAWRTHPHTHISYVSTAVISHTLSNTHTGSHSHVHMCIHTCVSTYMHTPINCLTLL